MISTLANRHNHMIRCLCLGSINKQATSGSHWSHGRRINKVTINYPLHTHANSSHHHSYRFFHENMSGNELNKRHKIWRGKGRQTLWRNPNLRISQGRDKERPSTVGYPEYTNSFKMKLNASTIPESYYLSGLHTRELRTRIVSVWWPCLDEYFSTSASPPPPKKSIFYAALFWWVNFALYNCG